MFKKKVLLSFGLILALAAAGCGEKAGEKTTPTPEPTKQAEPTKDTDPTPEPTKEADPTPEPTKAPEPTPLPSYQAGHVVDFEDGNFGFVDVKSTPNSTEVELSVVDYNGSKALQAVPADGKVPYVAIDISSLAGDAIESVRSIELDMGISNDSGSFYSASGYCYYYIGEENTEKNAPWSVYLENKNPKRAVVNLADDESFKLGAKNIIILTKETDNAQLKAGSPCTMYIDNIVLKDADGKELALNTAAEFDAPDGFGEKDWSNLTPVKNEVVLAGMEETTNSSWWPTSGITTDPAQADAHYVDPKTFGPGQIMTIYLSFDLSKVTEEWQRKVQLIGQSWTVENSEVPQPGWEALVEKDIAEVSVGSDSNGPTWSFKIYNLPMNNSYTIAQISYDTVASYLGEDWFKYVKFLGVGDYGFDLTVSAVTVGEEKKVLPATQNDVEIEGFAAKAAGWAQAGVKTVNAGGTFDVSLLKPGCVVTINYKSQGSMWLVANPLPDTDAPYGWKRVAYDEAAGKALGKFNDDNTQVQITYEQIVEALGTEDFSTLQDLQCESNEEWEVYSVTIGEYAPEPYKYKDEVMIDGTAVKESGWAQAGVNRVADGGTFDYTQLAPGKVINIHYKDNGANYWLVVNAGADAPYGWKRIGVDEGNGYVNTCRVDRTNCIVQITYEELVAALGSDDLSWITQLQAESSEAWEIYGIGIATLVE